MKRQRIRLSSADQVRFAEALLSPPVPSPALTRAFTRKRRLLAGAVPDFREYSACDRPPGSVWVCFICGRPRDDTCNAFTRERIREGFAGKPGAAEKLATLPAGGGLVCVCDGCTDPRWWDAGEAAALHAIAIRHAGMTRERYVFLRERAKAIASRRAERARAARIRLDLPTERALWFLFLLDDIWCLNHIHSPADWETEP